MESPLQPIQGKIEETIELPSDHKRESRLFNVSVRGLMALLLTATVCAMALLKIEIDEKIFTLVGMAVAFYFGQKSKEGQR